MWIHPKLFVTCPVESHCVYISTAATGCVFVSEENVRKQTLLSLKEKQEIWFGLPTASLNARSIV